MLYFFHKILFLTKFLRKTAKKSHFTCIKRNSMFVHVCQTAVCLFSPFHVTIVNICVIKIDIFVLGESHWLLVRRRIVKIKISDFCRFFCRFVFTVMFTIFIFTMTPFFPVDLFSVPHSGQGLKFLKMKFFKSERNFRKIFPKFEIQTAKKYFGKLKINWSSIEIFAGHVFFEEEVFIRIKEFHGLQDKKNYLKKVNPWPLSRTEKMAT